MENTRHIRRDGRETPPQSRQAAKGREFHKDCHSCPRNGKGDPFCWQVCQGPADDSNKGRSNVRLGGIESEGEFVRDNLDDASRRDADSRDGDFVFFDEEADNPSAAVTATLTEDTERNMVIVISSLFALPDIQLCILKHLLFGEDYATIGRTLPKPISKEAVQKHLVQMKGKCKFFASIMRQMQLKGVGGAKRRQAYNLEFDL